MLQWSVSASGNYSLRIHLEDFDGNQRYAEYKNFKVAEEKVCWKMLLTMKVDEDESGNNDYEENIHSLFLICLILQEHYVTVLVLS